MAVAVLTFIAVFLRVLSNPLGNVFQKQLTAKGHYPLLVNFLTYLLLSLVCLVFGFGVSWHSLPSAFWLYAVADGVAGALGNFFLVRSLQKGDLSVLGPINSYKSVVSIVFGVFLLHEIPSVWGVIGMTLIVYGSYFVLGTTGVGFSWALLKRKEIQYRIWAMVLTAIEAVFVKKMILLSSTTTAFISWCWFGALFSFMLLLLYRVDFKEEIGKLKLADLSQFGLLILCIGTMQLTTNYAFAHMPVGYALSLFQLSTVVSILLGYRFFQETEIRKKLVGSVLMIAGSVIIILL
ncbi:putative membrane protein [Pontibacter ummariensis]|uniref:Uncharacterized membrane protein n=1 Tax=Pontibacter ummariensis TaxID=1610492 RepID=A0A239KSU9_9BACT|nr:EamA family transporter [Pontibacter ummariensis]PRY05031.1 putative membrane protein [Pontibacter ummariensis]SNT21426.1 Uncharacterized membrane protein [Pontibacter ummariensis]